MADRMDHAVYDADILEWSEHQAALLRRAAAGERVNDLDWPNIIEEIESVGRSEFHAVESLLTLALLHDLKCEAWPLASYVPHWRAEARGFRIQAMRRFAPSMGQRLNVDRMYGDALKQMPESMDGQQPLPVPGVCPVTLDELLGGV